MNLKRALLAWIMGLTLALLGILGPTLIAQAADPDSGLMNPLPQPFMGPRNVHHPAGQARMMPEPALAQLPLRFISNQGQTDPAVKFHVHSLGGSLFFSPKEVVFSLPASIEEQGSGGAGEQGREKATSTPFFNRKSLIVNRKSEIVNPKSVVRLTFGGANPTPAIEGLNPLPGGANFFLGNDPAQWQSNLPTYEGIVYRGLYPGIDLVYRGTEGQLKSEFIVAPGAAPNQIRLRYEGAESLSVREDGALVIQTAAGELVEAPLLVYQEVNGVRREVEGHYLLLDEADSPIQNPRPSDGQSKIVNPAVAFQIAAYDPTLPLIIDPELVYSSYLGGTDNDGAIGIAVDNSSNIYITGLTASYDFPVKQAIRGDSIGYDAFVTELVKVGGVYTYGFSTYLGGSGDDAGSDIAVDNSGNIYVSGHTIASDFPTWQAIQGDQPLWDLFVTKIIRVSGVYTLGFSTYLGGGNLDLPGGLDVDSAGNIYVSGSTDSTDFPTLKSLQNDQPTTDAFVTQIISASGVYTFGWSTYLGGNNNDSGVSLDVDNTGNVYVAGFTNSTNFPTWKAIRENQLGGDIFVTKIISVSGVYTYGYSTYLGGSLYDAGGGIAVDSEGNVYITGITDSTDFPMRKAIQANQPGSDTFVTQIISAGGVYTYGYSTYLGGSGNESGLGIVADNMGNVQVTGETESPDFPTLNPLQSDQPGTDAFVTQVISTGGVYTYRYSTYLGGNNYDSSASIATDNLGNTYITGRTNSTNFLIQNATQGTNGGLDDAFIAKITSAVPTCFAQVNTISTTFSSSDAQAVQQAVDVAPSGDLVKVAGYCAGVSTRAGLTQTVYISKPLTLQGGYTSTDWITPHPLSYPTTLDAQSLGRVGVVNGGIPVTIADLNMINGNAQSGGGIYNSGVLTLSHTLVSSNTAAGGISFGGGGIYNFGTLTLADTTVKGNKTYASGGILDARGGGIRNQSGSVTLNNSNIISNSSIVEFGGPMMGHADGGGIYNVGGIFTLNNSTLGYNSTQGVGGMASGLGGGVFNHQGTLIVNNSSILSNTTISAGGGIYNFNVSGSGSSLVIMNNSTIRNNTAYNGGGGGLYNEGTLIGSSSVATLTNSTISNNTASSGGGIYNRSFDRGKTSLTLINSTISSNMASSSGGGIYNESDWTISSSLVKLTNSTISSNTAGSGSGIYNISANEGSAIFTLTNTLIASNFPGGNCLNSAAMIVSNGHNLENSNTCSLIHPSDIPNTNPLLGPLQDNGGATFTHALLPGSPAINAGDNATCAAAPINGVDQRGFPRDAACDIGAYEASAPVLTLAKTATLSTVTPGERITYTLVISNNGPISATQAVISDTLPNGLFLVGPVMLNPLSTGSVGTPPTLVNNLTVASGQLITVTFPVTVSSNLVGGTVMTNVATITSTEISRPVTGTALISIVSLPAITLTKPASASNAGIGETITYTYHMTNTGNVTLTGVTASDDKLGQIALTQTVLAPNQSTSDLLTYTVAEADLPGPLTNTVIMTGTPPTGPVVTATDEVSVALVAAPAVTVSKTASLGTAKVGQTITYTYRITNSGNITLTAVSAGDDKLGQVSLSQATLAPHQSASGTLTYTVIAANLPGPLANTVVVTGTPPEGQAVTAAAKVSVALLPPDDGPDESVYLPLIVKNH